MLEFNRLGTFVREIGQDSYGFMVAQQLRIDPQDNVWTVDEFTNMVIKWDTNWRPQLLLGRKAEWPEGRYSTLAGFVEPGESLEDAVAREVREEAGVELGAIRYFASQPWPYPLSIMLGFFAEATTEEIRIGDELEDAKWFTRDEVRAMIAKRSGALPGIDTIARRLIHAWLAW